MLFLLLIVQVATAVPVADFYDRSSAELLQSADDASAEVVLEGASFVFYGTAHDRATVRTLSQEQ